MYEELIKRLRKAQAISEDVANDLGKPPRTEYREAADAIEGLKNKLVITECERGIYAAAAATIIREPQWISVEEQLPESTSRNLVTCNELGGWIVRIAAYYAPEKTFKEDEPKDITKYVTHWMPLPQPPKEEKEEK